MNHYLNGVYIFILLYALCSMLLFALFRQTADKHRYFNPLLHGMRYILCTKCIDPVRGTLGKFEIIFHHTSSGHEYTHVSLFVEVIIFSGYTQEKCFCITFHRTTVRIHSVKLNLPFVQHFVYPGDRCFGDVFVGVFRVLYIQLTPCIDIALLRPSRIDFINIQFHSCPQQLNYKKAMLHNQSIASKSSSFSQPIPSYVLTSFNNGMLSGGG